MSGAEPMPSVRRRPIPGMASQPVTPPVPAVAAEADQRVEDDALARKPEASAAARTEVNDVAPVRSDGRRHAVREAAVERRRKRKHVHWGRRRRRHLAVVMSRET
jgi:hypothetical protein